MAEVVRQADPDDLVRITEIYNRYIVDSHVSFDTDPWPVDDRIAWFRGYSTTGRHRVFVVEEDGLVVGTAYSSRYRDKAAYDTSVETTVVLDPAATGRGLGRRLLETLLDALASEDVHRAYAIIALPNQASVALHEALGYRTIGVLDEVGRKLGRYWSTALMERRFD